MCIRDRFAGLQHDLPLGGEVYFFVPPVKQGKAQLLLQLMNLAADGGLGGVQFFGGPGEALVLGHREKGGEQTGKHGKMCIRDSTYIWRPKMVLCTGACSFNFSRVQA